MARTAEADPVRERAEDRALRPWLPLLALHEGVQQPAGLVCMHLLAVELAERVGELYEAVHATPPAKEELLIEAREGEQLGGRVPPL